ncbi:MAG: hypothetical protein LBN93_05950 [Candidatus Symbiothrix sp.]|nr:hypothetical protein [Candidatus Symbiothrix sp.]
MTDEEKAGWQGTSSLAGFRHSSGTWVSWGYSGWWWSSSAANKGFTNDDGSWTTPANATGSWFTVRCVRDI